MISQGNFAYIRYIIVEGKSAINAARFAHENGMSKEDVEYIFHEPYKMDLEKKGMALEIVLLRLDRLALDSDIHGAPLLRELEDEDLNLEGSPYIRSPYTSEEIT